VLRLFLSSQLRLFLPPIAPSLSAALRGVCKQITLALRQDNVEITFFTQGLSAVLAFSLSGRHLGALRGCTADDWPLHMQIYLQKQQKHITVKVKPRPTGISSRFHSESERERRSASTYATRGQCGQTGEMCVTKVSSGAFGFLKNTFGLIRSNIFAILVLVWSLIKVAKERSPLFVQNFNMFCNLSI